MEKTTFQEMTLEHLDGGSGLATAADLDQFRRACVAAMEQLGLDAAEATAYVWGAGDAGKRIRELLGEEPLSR